MLLHLLNLEERIIMNGKVVTWMWITVASLVVMLSIVACGATPETTAVEPTEAPPTPTAVEPAKPSATPTAVEPTQPPAEERLFPPEGPSAVRGRAVYEANCVTCHGAAGDGSGLPGAANFTDAEFMRKKKPAEFFESIRDGVEGTAMPSWSETLSAMDMWDAL
jgi:mono/diheme cytochrome c family protein